MINWIKKRPPKRRRKPYRKKIEHEDDVYDFRYTDSLIPLLEMRSRYQHWIRNLKASEFRNTFLMYMRFPGYPFCQYMPYFDITSGILYFINKPLWEYHKWYKDGLHKGITTIWIDDITEFRFVNTVIYKGNTLYQNNLYYSNILDNNYIDFLHKYQIINGKKSIYIKCWIGSRPWKGSTRIPNLTNGGFVCTDQKLFGKKKIIKVGEIRCA